MKRPALTSPVVIAILGAAGAITPMTVDMTLPALPEIARSFNVSASQAQLTISIFLIAYAVTQLIYGPLSDRFGRRPVLLSSLGFFVLASLGCIFAPTIEVLLAGRFVQGMGAAGTMAIGRACIRDIYGHDATRAMSFLMMWTGMAPILAPLIGGFAVGFGGWPTLFMILLVFSLAIWLVVFLFLAETNVTPNPDATRARPILKNFATVLRHRVFLGYALVTIGLHGSLFTMLSGLPFILKSRLQAEPHEIGLSFATLMLGQVAGTMISARLSARRGAVSLVAIGAAIMLSALGGLLFFTGSSDYATGIGFERVVGPLMVFMLGFGIATPSVYAGVLAPFPTIAGSVSSLMGVIQFIAGAVLGAVAVALSNGTGQILGAQMFVLISVAALAAIVIVRPGLNRLAADAGR